VLIFRKLVLISGREAISLTETGSLLFQMNMN
jgi:hypothetical protein